MDSSRDIHTDLMLRHGDVQMAPEQALVLNQQPVAKFVSNVDRGLVTAGYQVTLTGYAEFIRYRELRTNTYRFLDDLLKDLRALPRPSSAKILKGSASTFKLEDDAYRIDYRIANGEVVVYNIQPTNKLQNQRDRLEQPALYRVKRNNQGFWQVSSKVDKVTTTYAAVNGQSNNLTKATWLMGAHLEEEYKTLHEYTLFHNPSIGGAGDTWESLRDKLGITTPVTRQFARILADTQAQDNKTQWVVHSQGALIFVEGVRYLLNGESSSALRKGQFNGIRNKEKGHVLDKHSIIFRGNANNNFRSKFLLKRAGIEVLAIRANDFDPVANILGANTINPRKLIGSLVYLRHATSGSVAQSTHTLSQDMDTWRDKMENGPGRGRSRIQKAFNKLETGFSKKSAPNNLP